MDQALSCVWASGEEGAVKPYYEREGVTIYLGDCRDVLPELGRDVAGLLVADPP